MKYLSLLALPLSLATLTACGAGMGNVSTRVTGTRSAVAAAPAFVFAAKPDTDATPVADAPITEAVSAVTLAVEKIVAHNADEGAAGAKEGSENDGSDGWEVLVATPQNVDLLAEAANPSTTSTLGTSNLAAGKYTQIRLYLKDTGSTITVGGESHPLRVPSGALKLVGNATIEEGKTYALEISFDLDKSLVVNDQGYKLKPTVKYTLTEQ